MPINLFSRDTQYDVGYEPSDPGIALWQSPDIVPRNTQVTDYVAGGLYDHIPAVDEIRPSQDNYVYTRIRSRQTTGSATNVRAKLWWSEPGTLAIPDSWRAIGGTLNVLGPTGETTIDASEFPRVAEFTWPSSSVPALGHYCLVSSIWSDDDSEVWVTDVPVLGFSEWIRYQNNVAWRNVNVVAAAPTSPPCQRPVTDRSPDDYHFFRLWANTPSGEEDAIMRLGLATKLPEGTLVEVEGTEDFLERINPRRLNRKLVTKVYSDMSAAFEGPRRGTRGTLGQFTRFENTPGEFTHCIPLQFDRMMAFTPTRFAANKHEKVALNIWVPKKALICDIPVVLTQEFQNRLLGGMTWRLARPDY